LQNSRDRPLHHLFILRRKTILHVDKAESQKFGQFLQDPQAVQKGRRSHPPTPARQDAPFLRQGPARSATRRIMSVTFADGREPVSAQCLEGEAYPFSPPPPERVSQLFPDGTLSL
jgi:hypothetical protein